jgi:hypothetical protein
MMARAGDRKPRSNQRRRNIVLSMRVSEEELADFDDTARKNGFDDHKEYLVAFIRGRAHLRYKQNTELREFVWQLSKIGTNINQIARAVNKGKLVLDREDGVIFNSIRALLERIRHDLHRLGW